MRFFLNRLDWLWNWINQFTMFFSRMAVRAFFLVWVGSHSSGVRIIRHLSFWVPYSMKNILIFFFRFVLNQLWNWINQFIRVCSLIAIRALFFVWVDSHSSGVRIVLRCFFWALYSMRNILQNLRFFLNWINRLENWINRFIRFFPRIAVRALCLVWVNSHSSRVEIVHRFFCWVP